MKIKIQEAWWSGWKTFGWNKNVWGIGIDSEKVEEAIRSKNSLEIELYKFKEHYIVSPYTVKEYALNHNTTYKAKNDTLLYVVPSTELKRVIKF